MLLAIITKNLDKNTTVAAILLDLAKEFDIFNRQILLDKIEKLGIRDEV